MFLLLPPNHFVHYASVALDEFDNFCRDILVCIVWYGDSVVVVLNHFYCSINCLKQRLLVNTCQHETTLIQCLRALC